MRRGWKLKTPQLIGTGLGGLLAVVLMTQPAIASTEKTPTDSVKSTMTDLVRIFANQDMNLPIRSADRLREIELALRSHVSFDEMARRSLGHPWSELTAIEQQVFTDLFIQFLAKSVARWKFEDPWYGRVEDYSGQLVTYLSERNEGRFSEVSTRIRSFKADTRIDFRLVNQSGDWRVYDIVADHVSVSDNYRAQFANILRILSFAELESAISKIPLLPLLEKALNRR